MVGHLEKVSVLREAFGGTQRRISVPSSDLLQDQGTFILIVGIWDFENGIESMPIEQTCGSSLLYLEKAAMLQRSCGFCVCF